MKRFEIYSGIPGGVFDPDAKENQIEELQKKTLDPNFWNSREQAESVMQDLNDLNDLMGPWKQMKQDLEELEEYLELVAEEGEAEAYGEEISQRLQELQETYRTIRSASLLDGKFDKNGAYFTIHSGAGGTEACDWVQMLLRMYLRWAEKKQCRAQTLDLLEAEGGIKSVTLQITGNFVYGLLKGEAGIHRLVRISPFDSNKRRHTSFASVHVSPVIDEEIAFEIRSEDIKVDTYRASGAGGQHVNTTDSAVRITHLETGIVVQCQNERSQHKNRATAMKMLASKLYEHHEQKMEEERAKHSIEKKGISWGNQIRSYVFHPYTMVKDHRTGEQTGNISAVMDGDIDAFIEACLIWKWEQEHV